MPDRDWLPRDGPKDDEGFAELLFPPPGSPCSRDIDKRLQALGLSARFKYVPWPQSRQALAKAPKGDSPEARQERSWNGPSTPTRNRRFHWTVRAVKGGQTVVEAEYSSWLARGGQRMVGYGSAWTIALDEERQGLLEDGLGGVRMVAGVARRAPLAPCPADVLMSLWKDGETVGDYVGFEQWAADLGYDEDSRKAFSIWQTCCDVERRWRVFLTPDERKEMAALSAEW